MSVYTHLDDKTLAELCQRFDVKFASATPITQGIQNSNWFITATNGNQYVLTLFEKRAPEEVTTLTLVLLKLEEALPVAAPLPVVNLPLGQSCYMTDYANKAITLTPKLAGNHPEQTTTTMCYKIGEALALLHMKLAELQPAQNYSLMQKPWRAMGQRERADMTAENQQLLDNVWQLYDALDTSNLPKSLTHADLFLDNTLWQADELTGVLDFTEVGVDHLVMDIAITVNDFCTNWQNVNFDTTKLNTLLAGYENKRPLVDVEKQALPLMLAMAAVRFWLLRLDVIRTNTAEERTGEHILVKPPEKMRALASYHLNQLVIEQLPLTTVVTTETLTQTQQPQTQVTTDQTNTASNLANQPDEIQGEWVKLITYDNFIQADLLKQRLTQANILCQVQTLGVIPGLDFGATIWVAPEDATPAKTVLANIQPLNEDFTE